MPIEEGTNNIPQQAFTQWNDPAGTKLIALNRDGTIFSQGIEFANGTIISGTPGVPPGAVFIPIIQARLDAPSTTAVQSISFTATETTMFATSVFLESEGDGLDTDTVVGTLTFQEDDPTDTHTFTCVLHGGAGENIVMETYPVLVEVGTVITFSTAFSASVFTYSVSIRLVQMP
jgi:hypothetical protein